MDAETRAMKEGSASDLSRDGLGHSRYSLILGICAALVAGIGLTALMGWMLGLPRLASLGSGKIPVAPSTAALFVLYAGAVFLRARMPDNRTAHLTGLSINAVGMLLTALLFVLSMSGIRPEAEHLWFHVVNKPGEVPVGHMSPVTALLFVLSSLSYLLSLPSPHNRNRSANPAWWVAGFVITAGISLVLAYIYGTPLLYGSPFIPPAALTSLAFIALGAALLMTAAPRAWPSRHNVQSALRTSYIFLMVFVLLAAGIVLAGFLYFRNYEIRQRTLVEHQLSAIADLKAAELVQWRKERMGDAALFYGNTHFSGLVRRYLQRPGDGETEKKLGIWLRRMQESYQYDRVFLIDADGRARLSEPGESRPISRRVFLGAAEVRRTRQAAFEDFYRNEYDGRVYLAVLVPILDERGRGSAIGTLVLRIDPERYFYAFLNRWPAPSDTAETLLVRRDGNGVLFLNELRFRKNTALNLRRSLEQKELPAAQAVSGREGIFEGKDYRGVPVIADIRAVPGSPWFLVSRMDISEIYGPMREKLWTTVVLVLALVLSAGTAVMLAWGRQRMQFYREKDRTVEALEESETKLREAQEMAQLGHWNWDVRTGKVEWSEEVYKIFHIDPNDFKPDIDSILALSPWPGDHERDKELIRKAMESHSKGDYEQRFLRPDGSTGYYYSTFQGRYDGGGDLLSIVGTVLDITGRKHAEEEIRKLNEELEQRVRDRTAQLEAANKELEGFSYSVSHDLRAPLRHITGFAELLIKKAPAALDDKSRHYLSVISEAARQMGKLVDDLLSFSRMGRIEMLHARVDLQKIVMEVVEMFKTETKGRSIEWKLGDLPQAYGDRVMLRIVFENLISNAVKFTRPRTRAIIEIGCAADQPQEFVCCVKDNGVGFDMRYADKLFGLFQRLHRPEEFEGTGLGLANVRRIIHRHGGRTWAEGALNEGAGIFFTLPKIKEAQLL